MLGFFFPGADMASVEPDRADAPVAAAG